MGCVNNIVDKFGHQRVNQEVTLLRGLPRVGFKLTPNGQYNVRGKVLSNVAKPTNGSDAATKEYVLRKFKKLGFKYLNRLILL